MKQRLSLSVDETTARYLASRARSETNGNVSALVDRIVRAARLAECVRAEAAWYAAHPDYVETAEVERSAAGAA
ncbi:MAG TPA: hypothetical protein VLJ59_07545 [Mycobacteriales bacterium]|nr:hypothetical protein [Mycobacteriales bacterium]